MKPALIAAMIFLISCEGEIRVGSGFGVAANEGGMQQATNNGMVDDPFPDVKCRGLACEEAKISASPRVVRLTHHQWALATQELLKLDALPSVASFDEDTLSAGFFDNFSGSLIVTTGLWNDYRSSAEELALDVATRPEALGKLESPDAPEELNERVLSFIRIFGARAYRRPLTQAETDRLLQLSRSVPEEFPGAPSFEQHAEFLIRYLLQSPYFLYRIEESGADEEISELNAYEKASKLSFALWNSMPDAALFKAAEEGRLDTKEGLDSEVDRMMEDPRFEQTIVDFHAQVLDFDGYISIIKNEEAFPNFKATLPEMYKEELNRFFTYIILEKEGSWADVLNSRTAFLNAELAEQYGVEGDFDDTYRQAELPVERAGLLTRLGFLSYYADAYNPSPIRRGTFINRHVTCSSLPPAPDEFTLPKPEGTTNRELIHNATKGCGVGCHAAINPPGFAFENFDAMGILRAKDNGITVDTTGTWFLESKTFDFTDGVELSKMISERDQSHTCYSIHWFQYLFGRIASANDAPFLHKIGQSSGAGNISIKRIIRSLVTSDLFLKRLNKENE